MEAIDFIEDDSDHEYDTFLDQLEQDTDLYSDCIYCRGVGCSDCLL